MEALTELDEFEDDMSRIDRGATVSQSDFERVMLTKVTSLSENEVASLVLVCPRLILYPQTFIEKPRSHLHKRSQERRNTGMGTGTRPGGSRFSTIGERGKQAAALSDQYADYPCRIFYVSLIDELQDLIGLALPINSIYERFEPLLKSETPKPLSEHDRELANLFNF